MITNQTRDQLEKLGRMLSSRRVVDQAGYTLGLVSIDQPVQAALGPMLAEAQAVLESLLSALSDREIAKDASRQATRQQNAALEAATVWRGALMKRLSSAVRRGVDMPPGTLRMVGRRSPNTLASDIERLVKTATERLAELEMSGITSDMLEQGSSHARKLREADQHQEAVAWAQHREAVVDLKVKTAMMYLAVMHVHDMAASVHATNKSLVKRYRLRLMNRGAASPTESPPTAQPA